MRASGASPKPAETELLVRGLSEGEQARVELSPLTIERGVAHKVVTIHEVHDHNVTVEHDGGLLTNIPASTLYPYKPLGLLARIRGAWLLRRAMAITERSKW